MPAKGINQLAAAPTYPTLRMNALETIVTYKVVDEWNFDRTEFRVRGQLRAFSESMVQQGSKNKIGLRGK